MVLEPIRERFRVAAEAAAGFAADTQTAGVNT
jgi:hypothetical protein